MSFIKVICWADWWNVSIYTLPIKQRKTTQYKNSKFFRVHLKQMNFLSDITYFYISKIIRMLYQIYDSSMNTSENIFIMMSVSISWARVTLGLCLLLLIICPRDKRPCSSTVANTSRDLVTMVSCKAMATAVGSQSMNPGSRHSLCLSSNVRRILLWNMALVVFISNIFLNQSLNKAQK